MQLALAVPQGPGRGVLACCCCVVSQSLMVGGFEMLIEKFNKMPRDNFNGKIIMTFRNLEMVFDILKLYNCGLLNVKLRSDFEAIMDLGLLGGKPSKLKEALDENNKEALCNVMEITAARSPNDIIWQNYG